MKASYIVNCAKLICIGRVIAMSLILRVPDVAKKLTRQQYWEIIIVGIILFIVAYRVALVYDYIPDEYHPSVLADDVYHVIKSETQAVAADESSAFREPAQWSLEQMNAAEVYVQEKKMRFARAEAVAKRCNENMIFRFFMYMGDADNQECTQKNLIVNNAIDQIHEDTKKPDQQNTQGTVAPAGN